MKTIDSLVQEARREPLPALPSQFEAGVWRRIRSVSPEAFSKESSFFDFLLSLIVEPRVALVVCLFGVGIGTLWSFTLSNTGENGARSVGLEVFSGKAPDLPSTLIAQRR